MANVSRTGRRLLSSAALVGLLHAAFTIYWAGGGRWLLRTVGAWAVSLADSRPAEARVVLAFVAVAKIAGAVVPVWVEVREVGHRRWWRGLEWAGAAVLMCYGLINVLVGWAVLSGLISVAGGYDKQAELGHAALWDPLFLVWGVLLALGLLMTRDVPGHSRGDEDVPRRVVGRPAGHD